MLRQNKANLRDLIAATALVTLLKWVKLEFSASYQSHWWIPTRVTVRKCSIRVKICYSLSHVTLKFDEWHSELTKHLFYTTSSFVHHFKAIGEFKLELQSGEMLNSGKNPVWTWNFMDDLEKNRAPLLCYFKLCASFGSHPWIETGVTDRKRPIWVKINDFMSHVTLKFDI